MSQLIKVQVADLAKTAANAVPVDSILDAARDLMIDIGIRRTTMADVARAARVSRATLYRRFPNVDELAATVVSREFETAIDTEATDPATVAADELLPTIVGTVVAMTRAARGHPLLRAIIKHDPEFFLPYLLHRPGRTSDTQLRMLHTVIAQGVSSGAIRQADPYELAVSVLLTAWSFGLTGPVFADEAHPHMLDNQLTDLLTRYLTP